MDLYHCWVELWNLLPNTWFQTERVIIAEAQGQLKLTSSLKKIHQYLDSVKEEEEEEKESAE